MNEALKAQIERLKQMGIELDISEQTTEHELSSLLEQIDDQLAELSQLADIELDSDEPATITNMSALAIDINVQTKDIIADLGASIDTNDDSFAEEGLSRLFDELHRRALAFDVDDSESDPTVIGKMINACLEQHNSPPFSAEELQAIEDKINKDADNIYENVDDIWFEFCHGLDERGLSLLQLLSKDEIDNEMEEETIKLIAIPQPDSQKWTNRGFGHYVLLSFSELFLTE